MLLRWIWIIAAVLAVISIGLMLCLVLHRLIQQSGQRLRDQRGRELMRRILDYGHGDADRNSLIADIASERRNLGSRTLELAKLLRGEERERILELLRESRVLDSLIRSLKRGNQTARVAAAATLRLFKDKASVDALGAALEDRNLHVRLVAATSLALLEAAPPVAELLVRLRLKDVEGSDMLRELFRRLVATDPAGVAGLLDASNAPAVRLATIDALGRSGNFMIVPRLAALAAHDPDLDIRAEALRALGSLAHPRSQVAIEAALTDGSWEVRTQAAIAASRLGSASFVPKLVGLLDDPEWWPRFRAAEALARLEPQGIAALRKSAQIPTTRAGEIAQLVLLERGVR